jgi:hypothetical protein
MTRSDLVEVAVPVRGGAPFVFLVEPSLARYRVCIARDVATLLRGLGRLQPDDRGRRVLRLRHPFEHVRLPEHARLTVGGLLDLHECLLAFENGLDESV